MNVVLWIIAGLLTLVFLASGSQKVLLSKEQLVARGSGPLEDFSPGMIKLIGTMEVLAAIGLTLPAALDIAPVLVPLAALGLILLMIGAIVTHARRQEYQKIGLNLILAVLAVVVVWGRFGPYAF
jgi:uncharacterized membrane protein YphA (DoxX/SURF4 family)